MSATPPRLLAGATLLFWGALTGHPVIGLIAAILLEARSWLQLRWDFQRASYIKAWQFSILCGAFISILAWMNGMKIGKIHTLFAWAPLILLPLELAQRYGTAKQIPLNTFSFFARKKMEQDIAQGRSVTPRMINTGYPYITVVILATAMASRNELYHFIGLSIIIGSCLLAYMRKAGFRPLAWATAFLLVTSLAYLGQWGMFKLYNHYTDGEGNESSHHTSANEARTSIGRLGKIKLSPRIFWRMRVHEGTTPPLLRTATYNQYSRARWTHEFDPPTDTDEEQSKYDQFGYKRFETSKDATDDDRDIRWFTEQEPSLSLKEPITLIGEVDAKVEENPLPLPHFFLAIGDLDSGADIECNSLGTVRMANPNYNIVEYAIWTGDQSTTEEKPIGKFDLSIPAQELQALRSICQQLDLYNKNISTRGKIRILRDFFINEFEYSTHLTTPSIERGKRHSAIGIFLETTRSGHCEYFATATALLLREANIPTRYCVGFSVSERDDSLNEWVMRGQHAHAWCRVWIEEHTEGGKIIPGHWEDVDLTPPAWLTADKTNTNSWQQRFSDWWQRIREDFLIWRTRDTNKNTVFAVFVSIITLLILWVSWRLWQSRQRKGNKKNHRNHSGSYSVTTALHKIESLVAKKIGPRANGTPLCDWMANLIPLDASPEQLLSQQLNPAMEIHSIIRFDPDGASPEQHQQLVHLCTELKKTIRALPSNRVR